jgi:hypothetical protein
VYSYNQPRRIINSHSGVPVTGILYHRIINNHPGVENGPCQSGCRIVLYSSQGGLLIRLRLLWAVSVYARIYVPPGIKILLNEVEFEFS